jgi:endonuclease III related protein
LNKGSAHLIVDISYGSRAPLKVPYYFAFNKSGSVMTLLQIYKRLYKFYGPQGWWPGRTRFEVIVGAILTQNTAWSNVEKAISNLKEAKLLSPDALRRADNNKLAGLIRSAGYYNIKTKRLKNFISFLYAKYDGRLGNLSYLPAEILRKELLAVNGIGPETCDSIMLYAFKRPVFVVDAYTKRVFSRRGFFDEGADYSKIQKFFMNNLPKDERIYNEYHALIVRLAKDFCRTVPNCGPCPLFTPRRCKSGGK